MIISSNNRIIVPMSILIDIVLPFFASFNTSIGQHLTHFLDLGQHLAASGGLTKIKKIPLLSIWLGVS